MLVWSTSHNHVLVVAVCKCIIGATCFALGSRAPQAAYSCFCHSLCLLSLNPGPNVQKIDSQLSLSISMTTCSFDTGWFVLLTCPGAHRCLRTIRAWSCVCFPQGFLHAPLHVCNAALCKAYNKPIHVEGS